MSNLNWLEQASILVGVLSGLGGLFLGVYNTIEQRRAIRVQLTIRPRVMHIVERSSPLGGGNTERDVPLIHIANTGRIPAVLGMIGFHGGKKHSGVVVSPAPADGGSPLPRQLDPGHICMFRVDPKTTEQFMSNHKRARIAVYTQTDERFVSSRKSMRLFRQSVSSIASQSKP